jgi:general secretion pathway protein J
MRLCISQDATRCDKRRGFTLVEMLIAMMVLATVLTIAYRVFSSSYRALHQVDPDRDPFQTARIILDRMAEEIQSAYYRPGLSYTGFLGKDDVNDEAPSDSLTFSCMANFYWIKGIEGINESDFLKISYTLVDDQEERILMRAQDPSFRPFEENTEDLDTSKRGVHQLTDQVWGIDIHYFDGEEWIEEWNAEEKEGLPQAVEVKLILRTAEEKRLSFSAVIPVGSS